jgi:PAS domain S-box-containing protein
MTPADNSYCKASQAQRWLRPVIDWVKGIVSRPGFWLLAALLILITIPHYGETLEHPSFVANLTANLGLTRHSFERILYLGPIVWAGFIFGYRGAAATSVVSLICMLPRAIFISDHPTDAIFETGAVFVVGNVLAFSFHLLTKERERRTQLEETQRELRKSEQRYRELFESAQDGIWVHDTEGKIITANKAIEELTGYSGDELIGRNVKEFLSGEQSHAIARQVRQRLLQGEKISQPYEQELIRKDGTKAYMQLVTNAVYSEGNIAGFQHIARDVTREKQMQENLRFYLQEVTKAQEEERKRIARELHDDTIQALVVLSRELDDLASNSKGLSKSTKTRLESLRQQTITTMQGVRRLTQDLRPAALDRLGLLPALQWLASDVSAYSGTAVKVKVLGAERRLPPEVELILFRIAQEALRNVWRHSQATEAEIFTEFNEGRIRVTVSDNGKGFYIPETIGELAKSGKLGLVGMQERARLLGGSVKVESQPGKGTTVTVEAQI